MKNKSTAGFLSVFLVAALVSCSVKKYTSRYYYQNEKVLDQIEASYRTMYSLQAFSIAFMDKYFRTLSLEIKTDSLTYIYEFGMGESRINDTALKYHLNPAGLNELTTKMRSVHCSWISKMDYYTDNQRKLLVFMSIKPVVFSSFFSDKKYYIITYYSQPQHFDPQGRLLDRKRLRQLRKINGEVFHRINDKVCYSISSQFR